MGIAKSIEGYSIYDTYLADTNLFIRDLSQRLNSDFIINIYDKEYNSIGEEDFHTTFDKTNRFNLTIVLEEHNILNEIVVLPVYELTIPINFVYEKSLNLVFYPNKSLHIMFLTFEHLWASFIDELKFQSDYGTRQEAISRYQNLRNEYKPIFKKIGIEQILITTHAYYNIENITDYESFQTLEFADIINEAKEKDNIAPFDFCEILNTAHVNQLNETFKNKAELEIMLLDTLQ